MPELEKAISNFCMGEWADLQWAWDATSMRELMICPRRYYYRFVLGYVREGARWDLDWGRYYHVGMDALHTGIAKGLDRDEALREALRTMLLAAGKIIPMFISGKTDAEAEPCWHPWDSDPEWRDHNKKNRSTLIRALIWYCEALPPEDTPTVVFEDGTVATELSFRIPLAREIPWNQDTRDGIDFYGADMPVNYILCGHFDNRAQIGAERMLREFKTTKKTLGMSYFNQFWPDPQVDIYALAQSVIYPDDAQAVLVEACQCAVGFNRFDREVIRFTPERLDEIAMNLEALIAQAEVYAKSGYWPMNTSQCDMYGGCPYRPVCRKSPSLRQNFLDNSIGKVRYVKDVWNPLEER